MEAGQLKLASEDFPLPCSLAPLVLQRFADAARSDATDQAMSKRDLLSYIIKIDNVDTPPLDAVLEQTEVIGEPALPMPKHTAILGWVGAAAERFEELFPLEEPLAGELRKLRPLVAAVAISDTKFLTPGAHPLHQILDAIQACAIGWQPNLGRAGKPVEQLVSRTVADALTCFQEGGASLGDIAKNVIDTTRRNRARIDRMVQRLIESEQGQAKSAEAKVTAARMINSVLQQLPLPAVIGSFLKGAWYDSAQLVLLKFGDESNEWRAMSETTHTLGRSLQLPEGEDESYRQRLVEITASLPKEIRRWLLSKQHEQDVVDQVVEEIEYAHLRLLRHQPVDLTSIEPLAVDTQDGKNGDVGAGELPANIVPGQWFSITLEKGDVWRLQLASTLEAERQLLFCNHAGLKARVMDYATFARLLQDDKAIPLLGGAAYSRTLTEVAGIDSVETLERLTGISLRSEMPAEKAAAPGSGDARQADDDDFPEGIPDLPMGTWLGFHDTDPPLLAKLALQDKVRHLYIFVNRQGIELRRLEAKEYLALFEKGLVDILETRSTFRDQVEEARKKLRGQ